MGSISRIGAHLLGLGEAFASGLGSRGSRSQPLRGSALQVNGLVGYLCVFGTLGLLALASGAGVARGEETSESPPQPSDDPLMEDEFSALDLFERVSRLRPRIQLEQDFTIDQDFSGAEVDSFTSGLRTSIVVPVSRKLALRLVARMEGSYFDFHGDRRFLDTGRTSGDPFDELLASRLRLEARYRLGSSWAVFGGAQFSSRWEAGARYDDGIEGGGFFGAGYIFADRLSLLLGMGISSRMGRSGVSLSPLVRVGLKLSDDVEIQSEGLGGRIVARLRPGLKLFINAGLKSTRYRLGDRSGLKGGSLRNQRVPIEASISWRFTQKWRFRVGAGAVAYQKYSVSDTRGNSVDSTSSSDPAFTGNLELEYRF